MKTRLLYPFLLLSNLLLFYYSGAQSFRQGATWHYDTQEGIYIYSVEKDTTIAGSVCSKITCETRLDTTRYRARIAYELPTLFLQDRGDTIFAYNELFSKFTPLYVFNVSAGDTLNLPGFPPHPCESYPWRLPDSNFRYVIDSVRMVRWDTSLLKTVYGRGIRYAIRDTLSMDWSSQWGVAGRPSIYVQHAGAIYSGLMPNCQNCAAILDGSCRWIDSLRCYSDRERSIKLVSGECDKGLLPTTALKPDPGLSAAISIYPNPAENYVSLTLSSGLKGSISILDILGKEVIRRESDPSGSTRIDISGLSRGTYIARIISTDGSSWFGKLNKL